MAQRALWLPWRRDRAAATATAEPSSTAADNGAPPGDGATDELAARRAEIARMEERALRETESLAVRSADLERRAQALDDRDRNLTKAVDELKQAKRVQRRELERLSGLSVAQAKQLLIADVEQEAKHQAGLRLQEIEEQTRAEAERRARNILAVAMQRLAAKHSSESTTRLVELPNDEMKGRIIGRDGRNIRALEKLTGVDVIIDETPSAVVLSSFDGVRREVARITLERLIADGRIHPAQIEETYEHARQEIDARIVDEGERAALEARVSGLDPELARLLGQLRFRTSYGQNVLDHLVECSHLAALMAEELGASVETARRGALLHDIGKAVTHEVEGPHAQVGAQAGPPQGRVRGGRPRDRGPPQRGRAAHGRGRDRAGRRRRIGRAAGRPRRRARAIRRAGFVTSRRSPRDNPGVERVFAMRAGREIRVIVDPGEVDDEAAALIAHEIAAAVEKRDSSTRGGSRSR